MRVVMISVCCVVTALSVAKTVVAQDDAAPPVDERAAEELDLDALLGLDEAEPPTQPEAEPAENQAVDPNERRLERELTGEQAAEELEQAVQLMSDAADLLRDAGDVGVPTQRLHQEIITKLDILVEFAEQQQQQQQQQGQQQQQQQSQQQQQQQAGQQQGARQQGAEQRRQQQANDSQGNPMPPGFEQGPLADIDTGSAAWGALPARLRERLLEGASDRFSSLHRAATEAYYRRLAEQAAEGEQ
ncbi:MAG: hypothetical protein AAGI30_05095 [Planctomycetota bacterium]